MGRMQKFKLQAQSLNIDLIKLSESGSSRVGKAKRAHPMQFLDR
jgi:hypothetical protein